MGTNLSELRTEINKIQPADPEAMEQAKQRQDILAKPPGSLGELEKISIQLAGITGKVKNQINTSCVAVFCADNGVADEGIASSPQSVTAAQTMNFTRRLTGVGALSVCFDSELLIVDMGVKEEIPEVLYVETPLSDTHKIVNRRLRAGTSNLAEKAAMTEEEAVRCLMTGFEMADAIKTHGFDIMGVGEMGIGNTTTSAALISAVTGLDSEATCGKGAGIVSKSFLRKKEIIDQVTAEYRKQGGALEMISQNQKDRVEQMVQILAQMGGFDICAMAGAFLGAAKNRMPVVIDGFISVAAALVAYVMEPKVLDYMFASHASFEKGYKVAVDELGLTPFLNLGMRLGEGSGCPIAFEIIRGACDVMCNMATFEEAAINDDYLEEIRKGGCF